MAAAKPSNLASSVEKTNGAKLSRLLIDGGSTVLRKIFDGYHSPANLLADFSANFHTLNNLLKRRVLHKPQWDLLFPPGGAIPDSNTFDITLLFLLLTNICGLYPPPSGWHIKPPPNDASIEANLARIKFFRNKLYGHVTTTGIDTPTFSALWLEISTILVALGLPQADIDRLKAEHCAEEEFFNVLFEWAESEEDIKSQLKDIRQTVDQVHQSQIKAQQTADEVHQSQIKTQQTVDEVHQSQIKAQQTVDEVHQSQIKTQHIVDEVHQSQIKTQHIVDEVHQSQIKAQQTVDEVHQSQIKTQHTVDEVHQSQIKAQQTVDEVHQSQIKAQHTVDEVHQSQIKTQQTVDEVHQSQIKTQHTVDEVHQSQIKAQQTVDEVHQSQIKTQHTVDEVHQSQIKTQQTVDEVHQSQIKAQQTVDEVHQSQIKTQQTVDEVHQSQIKTQQTVDEVHQSQIKTQQTVDEVHQSQIKTQQTVDEVHQSQIKAQQTVDELHQSQSKTHHVVTNVSETQINDSKAIHEIRHTQHEIHKTLQETTSKVEEIQKAYERGSGTQDEGLDCFQQDLQLTAKDLKGQREKQRENEILKKLAKIETLKNVRYHADRYVEGTRLSIFAKVESWLNDRSSPNRVMVVSGNAGMGKSVISAIMCEKMQEAGRLAGNHFCQHDSAFHRNPKAMLQSLASQLCDILPDYKKALVEKLSRNLVVEINNMEVKGLFQVLFEEPLANLKNPGLTYLMVMDGLDESEFQGRNELVDVIANYFQNLPMWIRFLVTTRPERNIAENLKNLHPLQLDPNVEENLKDIYLCFEKQVSHSLQSEHREIILEALVQKSEGVMLYAHYLVDFIKKKESFVTPELLDSILPSGIVSVYHSYFKRLETELCAELMVTEDKFLNFLRALAAAREPLPLGFVSKLLLPVKSTSVTQGKVNAAISCVSALLPIQDDSIHFFHKSVKDWLIEKSEYRHTFFTEKGHEVLSKLCIEELGEVKRKGVDCAQFRDTTKYALRHGVQHMLQPENARVCSLKEVVTKFVLDSELVYAKLCVNVTAASEDIVCVQKQAGIEELQSTLNTLLVLLRKHLGTLDQFPHAIFQTLLNEGGPKLSSDALHLLETKYSEIAYIEYLHKEDLQGRVLAKFECSAAVACFDVSPQLDYMVCECYDNTIQLWSLHTGKQLWKRDVKVTKDYYFEYSDSTNSSIYAPYRAMNNYYYFYGQDNDDELHPPMSLYRSVVFHPTKDLVLPGILSHAYTFEGNLKPLLPSSKCCFYICSISADKMKMLTDCPGNNAESIVMWSLTDGSEINRFSWNEDIVSFAWSREGRLLAISDLSGSIGLVDVMDGFKPLALVTTSRVCGMIKFSPDCRCLYSLCFDRIADCKLFRLDVTKDNDGNFSLDVLPEEVCYEVWEFESCSETGFLLGDPFHFTSERDTNYSLRPGLAFVLDEQSVLTVSYDSCIIEMLQLDELTKDNATVTKTTVERVVLSLNGDKLFVLTETNQNQVTLMACDISTGMFKPGKRVFEDTGCISRCNLVAVSEGVLLHTSYDALELWNFELSECIRSWTDLGDITEVIPISEERVACDGEGNVIIVDTTREGIVSTIPIDGLFIACNSKCQVITADDVDLQMQCGDKVLWKISHPFKSSGFTRCHTFSPTEQYFVLPGPVFENRALYVLDVGLGETLHTIQPSTHGLSLPENLEYKFVGDEECVTCFGEKTTGYFLQLFNVKSCHLLSEISLESLVYSLAACPRERLIAIGFEDSNVNFKVLQVNLPGDKHSRKNKRSGFDVQLY